jgi:hypothetical protein
VRGAVGRLVAGKDFLVQLLAGPQATEADFDLRFAATGELGDRLRRPRA